MFKLLFVVLAAFLALAFASPVPAPQYVHGVAPVVSGYYGSGAVVPSVYSAGVYPSYNAYSAGVGVVPATYSSVYV